MCGFIIKPSEKKIKRPVKTKKTYELSSLTTNHKMIFSSGIPIIKIYPYFVKMD